ncbi:hypothetical protein GQ473_05315, partial [archaeon]|nr:hypothetical protein [archaeon]
VTDYQRAQICRDRDNLYPISALGRDFTGCKGLTDIAVNDPDLVHINFVAPNSKSIARLLPQMAWYVYFAAHVAENTDFKKIEFFTPSGNYGNSTAGVMALNAIRTGAELSGESVPEIKINIASNDNNVVPAFYNTGKYVPEIKAIPTHSNAMDVADPSNFKRILAMYGLVLDSDGCVEMDSEGWKKLNEDTTAQSVSQKETEETLRKYYVRGIQICPHGAVGLTAMGRKVDEGLNPNTAYISILTADPSKFSNEINTILGQKIISEPIIDWKYDENPRTVANYTDLKEIILKITNN